MDQQDIVLKYIYDSSDFLNQNFTLLLSNDPVTVILDYRHNIWRGIGESKNKDLLPPDPINHAHKERPKFYFIILLPNIAYEGYIYLLQPSFHVSLLFKLTGELLDQRKVFVNNIRKPKV